MSFNKTILSVATAAMLATSAFSATVAKSNDGHGDYLLYPVYYATTDGWKTDIRVVNTNTTSAVVAKVVVREWGNSNELIDFPIYLSPGDVWTAELINGGDDHSVRVVSTDDSSPLLADLDTPVYDNYSEDIYGNSRPITYGYVEIQTIAEANATIIAADQNVTWSEFQPLAKSAIKDHFQDAYDDGDINNDHNTTKLSRWNYHGLNAALFGQQTIISAESGNQKSMTLPAAAFKATGGLINSWIAITDGGNGVDTGRNPLFGTDTSIDDIWGTGSAANIVNAQNTVSAVNAINYVKAPVETQVVITRPFESALNSSVRSFNYNTRVWDNSENTPDIPEDPFSGGHASVDTCNTEICWILYPTEVLPDYPTYNEGWFHIDIDGTAPQATVNMITGVAVGDRGITNIYPAATK
jgi:hypothetical protein